MLYRQVPDCLQSSNLIGWVEFIRVGLEVCTFRRVSKIGSPMTLEAVIRDIGMNVRVSDRESVNH